MFNVGDYVIYKRQLCTILDIHKKYFNNEDYYVLESVDDKSLKINVPLKNSECFLRNIISKDKLDDIINNIPNIDIITTNEKLIENEYKKLLSTGTFEDLIKIINTTYERNKNRLDKNKKISDKDDFYFKQSEKYLYNEFSVVLNKSYDDTKKYVIEKVTEIIS